MTWGTRIERPSNTRREFWSGLETGGELFGAFSTKKQPRPRLLAIGGFYSDGVPDNFLADVYSNADGTTNDMWEVGRAHIWNIGSLVMAFRNEYRTPIVVQSVNFQNSGGYYRGPSNSTWLRRRGFPVSRLYTVFTLENVAEAPYANLASKIDASWNEYTVPELACEFSQE